MRYLNRVVGLPEMMEMAKVATPAVCGVWGVGCGVYGLWCTV